MDMLMSENYFIFQAKYYPDIHQHILTTKDPTLCQQLRLEYTKGIMQTVPLGQPYAMLALHEHEIKKFHAGRSCPGLDVSKNSHLANRKHIFQLRYILYQWVGARKA